MKPEIPDYLPENLLMTTNPREKFSAEELHGFGIVMLALGLLRDVASKYPGVASNVMTGQDLSEESIRFINGLIAEVIAAAKMVEKMTGCEPSDINSGKIDGYDGIVKEDEE